jgi:hypothetical protein
MVHQSTVTNAGLQSLCTSPKGKGSVSSEFNDFEVGSIEKSVEKSGTISRFRTLNDEEQQRQVCWLDEYCIQYVDQLLTSRMCRLLILKR